MPPSWVERKRDEVDPLMHRGSTSLLETPAEVELYAAQQQAFATPLPVSDDTPAGMLTDADSPVSDAMIFPYLEILESVVDRAPWPLELQAQWLIKIHGDSFSPMKTTHVCSMHFQPGDLVVTAGGLRRLKKGATPVLFSWNEYALPTPRPNVWERKPRAESPTPFLTANSESEMETATPDRDYCVTPATAVMANEIEALHRKIRYLQHQQEVLKLRPCRVGRAHSFLHQALWKLVEPVVNTKMVRITNAKAASASSSEFSQLTTVCTLGLPLRDLAERFVIHRTTASRIIATWTHFLYYLLGSKRLWIPRETSEEFSTYKSHATFKAMIGMAPHGAIRFVSGLYAGSMSDREIFKLSGIANLLTPDMAIMVDKGFLVDNLAPCKVTSISHIKTTEH
ncbi:unnamed protein product [Leuciscus chuanchicus]